MSSDNGIYILKTRAAKPIIESDFEYRVIHAQAIENICYDVMTGQYQKDFVPEVVYDYFGECKVFRHEYEARQHAHELEAQHDILEYGVSTLDHSHQIFPSHLTQDDVERYEVEMDKEMDRRRAKREQARQAWLERNKVTLNVLPQGRMQAPNGSEFEMRVMYGEMKNADGSRLGGRVFPELDGTFSFIPDYNDVEELARQVRDAVEIADAAVVEVHESTLVAVADTIDELCGKVL